MKKCLIILAAIAACGLSGISNLSAQEQQVSINREAKTYYYVELMDVPVLAIGGRSVSSRIVSVNFGKEAAVTESYKIADEAGTGIIEFENAMGALNYLSAQGWEVVSVFNKGTLSTTCYLLRRDVSLAPTQLTKAIDQVLGSLTLKPIE